MLISALQHAWFTDLDGRRFLTASINRTPVLDLRLSELCAYVDQLVDLQEARIFSTESYAEWIGQIKHRFLVLELLRMRKPKDACLRLDRRRGENTSILRVVAPLGNNEANDRVRCLWQMDGTSLITRFIVGNVYY